MIIELSGRAMLHIPGVSWYHLLARLVVSHAPGAAPGADAPTLMLSMSRPGVINDRCVIDSLPPPPESMWSLVKQHPVVV